MNDLIHELRTNHHQLEKEFIENRVQTHARLENIKEMEQEQNESIKALLKDTRELRENQIKKEGFSSVSNFLMQNWFQLLLLMLVIFSVINEEKILDLIR